ncbi:hypothetical protein [Haloferula rosea]|uniref:Uncharacterized protein n=1 Tax=Haloferula rosea TaxID=490093 RepID=A0A934R6P2_9BACT|nr:hypothetical protein [Haloferula rosea]MBK1826274.1 hypothetical protein [Haloferula rosea]
MAACTTKDKIWNASDLEVWVKDQAVAQGYREESIQLEEWYRDEDGQLVWHGEGVEASSGKKSPFSIRVDKVWTPSGSD